MTSRRMIAAALAFALSAAPAIAHEIKAGTLVITHPWVHAVPAGALATGGFMIIHNTGHEADALIGAAITGVADAAFAEPVAGAADGACKASKEIAIPAGATVRLEPGKLGLVFGKVAKGLDENLYADGVLHFRKAGAIKVQFFIEAARAKASKDVVLADCTKTLPLVQ